MRGNRRLGLILIGGGAVLLAVAVGFFGYQAYIDERYEPVVSISTVPVLPSQQDLQQLIVPPPDSPPQSQPVSAAPLPDTGPAAFSATLGEVYSGEVYGGLNTSPQHWENPLWAEDQDAQQLTSVYLPVSEVDLPDSGLSPATLVRIPAIGLKSETIVLDTFTTDAGDLKFESPVFDVGIIPNHTNPGEVGNTWLFGHLESPLKGEGAVFRDLHKVHDFLRRGEPVYVIVDSDDGSFLYQATEFRILPQEDVYFWDSDGRTATLVSSWPRFKYDERVVVTAELVGVSLNPAVS